MIETTDKISKHFREILAERDVLANQHAAWALRWRSFLEKYARTPEQPDVQEEGIALQNELEALTELALSLAQKLESANVVLRLLIDVLAGAAIIKEVRHNG